ncbi:AraC family transcriptional regulator [Bacteroides uniformis]|uniref:AraC family transcriptional regulator n=1 Tax=Bacteroides uniformis TaxID=820 RepID=A0A1Y3V3U1_BACUN|nr:AraC family transcriptional regulator [Bacteroides uniformis]KAB4187132.1 AraC family transcriptional regulator [Bacteroides uniformis]MUT99768.1 AraC family transcriptional regulator [Bacteroides uniformis]OUN55773.1 AraC family transcriptional regulator [Bacteroides uniformis]
MMKIKDGFKGELSIVLPKAIIRLMKDDPLASSIYITDIGYYPKASNHYRSREKPIDEYVFIYCIDGKGWFEIKGKHYEVRANQYFILPAGISHIYAADETTPWTIYWIHFGGSLAQYYAANCINPQDVTPNMTSRINTRINLFEEIFNTLQSSFAVENIRYAMATFQHYLASLRFIQQYRAANTKSTHNIDIINLVTHFFNENIEKRLTLKDIADFSGLSQSRLSAIFKERTGHSPLNYFNFMKIRKACNLLDNTNMKLNQISLKLGIDDQYYFSRLFSHIMGLSPKAYRNRNKA